MEAAVRQMVRWRKDKRLLQLCGPTDRTGRGEKTAILWEGEPLVVEEGKGRVRKLTFTQLKEDVCRFANGLKKLGVKKGDRVTIYMPMTPEAAIAVLACARIGALHSVIFGGFAAQAIADRVDDADSHFLITADGAYRRGAVVGLKTNVDEALTKTDGHADVVVLKHVGAGCELDGGAGCVVVRGDRGAEQRLPGGGDGRGGHAVRAVHQRLDRQA